MKVKPIHCRWCGQVKQLFQNCSGAEKPACSWRRLLLPSLRREAARVSYFRVLVSESSSPVPPEAMRQRSLRLVSSPSSLMVWTEFMLISKPNRVCRLLSLLTPLRSSKQVGSHGRARCLSDEKEVTSSVVLLESNLFAATSRVIKCSSFPNFFGSFKRKPPTFRYLNKKR